MTYKKEHPIFTEAIDEPMGILAANYRRQKTDGIQDHGTDGTTVMGRRWLHTRLPTCAFSSEILESVSVGTSASPNTKA